MTTAALIGQLEARGVVLSCLAGKLQATLPDGGLPAELREALSARKDEIRALLSGAGQESTPLPHRSGDSPPQARIEESVSPGGGSEVEALSRAYQAIADQTAGVQLEWVAEEHPEYWKAVQDAEEALNDGVDRSSVQRVAEAYAAVLNAWEGRGEPQAEEGRFLFVTEASGLERVAAAISGAEIVGLDVETFGPRPEDGLNPRRGKVRLLSLAIDGFAAVIDVQAVDPSPLFPLLQSKRIVGHHIAFDLGFLSPLGFDPGPCECTMLLSQLVHAGKGKTISHSLAECADRELGVKLSKALQTSDWSGALSADQVDYAARDARVLLPLYQKLRERAQEGNLEQVADIERRALPAIVWLSGSGTAFDRAGWTALYQEAEAKRGAVEGRLNAAAPPRTGQLTLTGEAEGWDWGSPKQVTEAFRRVGIELPSTEDGALAGIDHPLAALMREWRGFDKKVTAYGKGWFDSLENGRIFAAWHQLGSDAGRMSCAKPNLQQVPRDPRYRACITAPPGRVLVKADYSQIEIRIAARMAPEPRLLEMYQQGADVHTLTAQTILNRQDVTKQERQIFKSANFGLLYGMSAEGLRVYILTETGIAITPADAARYRDGWFRMYAGFGRWHRKTDREAKPESRTFGGRRRQFIPTTPLTWRLNSPVQGTGADGLKRSLALLWERREDCPGAVPVIACHDEIVVECDEQDAVPVSLWLEAAMLDGMGPLIDPVPVVVEPKILKNWAG